MYVELHARSAFSWLRGASTPETLMATAAGLGMPALALCDRDGVYGAVRLHMTAKGTGARALVGCELGMEDGSAVPVLVATQAGYRRLCGLLTTAHLRAEKGAGRVSWRELEEGDNGGLVALTGDEDGPVRRAWRARGPAAAAEAGGRLRRIFGPDRLYVELQRHLLPDEEEENAFLADWAAAARLPLLATNGVLHAARADRGVADVFACLRHGVSLDGAGRLLAPNAERHLKPAAEMAALFSDLPEAVANTGRLAERLEFTLAGLGYRFPDYEGTGGQSQDSHLRAQVMEGARRRFPAMTGRVLAQLDRELALIAKLGFAGYFLMVWDICEYAREHRILIQGRGSAANSAVCFALGITAVDPIESKLLFERFLSEGRTDWPDIDLDLPSQDRREEVIQEMYRRHGRRGAAMTANVITFRERGAMREVGKVFGIPEEAVETFSGLFHHGDYPDPMLLRERLRMAGIGAGHPRLASLADTCLRVRGLPRHLGQHSGGMVLSAGNLDHFVPLENARMPGRSVLQWDKSDCEDMGIVKVDLLGLGMMAVLQDTLEICSQRGQPVDLATLPKDDPETFKAIQAADTVGLFQIESRAQMATLPRMKPACFYDLVIQVAIIRPGPIHGDAVNPYLQRRNDRARVSYLDERARPILERTLGVVLFQEQILQLAMELGRFTAAEADELRRAIGFTRSQDRLDRMKARFEAGLRCNGVGEDAIRHLLHSLASFALYGFPESHAISFALLAYASAWLRTHRPAAFYAALLNNQPMGFYSAASLAQDARRRGLRLLPACAQASDRLCRVDADDTLRLGLGSIHGVRAAAVARVLEERKARPFASLEDFFQRTALTAAERRAFAGSGALNAFAGHRRAALWHAEAARGELSAALPSSADSAPTPLRPMTLPERVHADYEHLALTTGAHPMRLLRSRLPELAPADTLRGLPSGRRVSIGGSVIARQRPGTAKGVCFITVEDETGLANAIVRPALFERERITINLEPALIITGRLQNEQGVVHVLAEKIEALPGDIPAAASHDFK